MLKICSAHFLCLIPEKPFLDKSVKKKSKLSVKAEIWYQATNLNIRNLMMLTFSVFDQKYLFVQI